MTYWASEVSPTLRVLSRFRVIYIRECDSTLYVGLVRAVSPTNTNFRLTFLLTRLQEALYEDLAVTSNLKSTITFLAFNS